MSILTKVAYTSYWRMQAIIAPSLQYSQSIYEELLFSYVDKTTRWIDLGCGRQVLPSWRAAQEIELVNRSKEFIGLDYDYWSLRENKVSGELIGGDIQHLPLRQNTFDLVTANMVFEHLCSPEKQLREIFRILKPGGHLIFHTPNSFGYLVVMSRIIPKILKHALIWVLQKRSEKDIFQTYYRINSRHKIGELSLRTGFRIVKIRMIVSCAQCIIVPVIAFVELLLIRILMMPAARGIRSNIIAVLQKPINETNYHARRSLASAVKE